MFVLEIARTLGPGNIPTENSFLFFMWLDLTPSSNMFTPNHALICRWVSEYMASECNSHSGMFSKKYLILPGGHAY